MVYWQKFNPEEFEYEFDEAELAGHAVTVDEVIDFFGMVFKSVATSVIIVAIKSSDILTVVAN